MQIEEITLTVPEMQDAVQKYLAARGLEVLVSKVDDYGYPVKGYKIACGVKDEPQTTQPMAQEAE